MVIGVFRGVSPGVVAAASFALLQLWAPPALAEAAKRVTVTGEFVDTWCAVSGIMFGYGSAHHQCAVCCAIGGIPVSIHDQDGKTYLVLRLEGETDTVSNPKIARFQSHSVTVDGDLIERDGVNYLFVDKIADDKGIVTLNQDEYGVIPFGE